MTPIIAGVVAWLKTKFPPKKTFPAPNDELSVRLDADQYQIFFINNADEAYTAATAIGQTPIHSPASIRRGVIIANSAATANDPQVQSAIESNYTGAASTYLGYLELQEVKKWPKTAP